MNGLSNSRKFQNHFNEQITKEGQNIIFEFFLTFSRFECALKNSIKYLIERNSGIEANWDLFVSEIRNLFNSQKNDKLSDAVNYLLANPTKKQYLENGRIPWRNRVFQENEPDINRLCQSIRDVRNNLMHGGKFQGIFEPDISRNYKLINSCLIILNEWLDLSNDVKQLFHKPIN